MATRRTKKTEGSVEITNEDVYMSKYDKLSEEKFAELEERIARLEKFEAQAKQLKGWWPQKWN
ncbi:hypothetical protein [Synechococcus phage S-8S56]|jgi:hypothetical protein|nr:hypothetical protein [Synechococcus phage S-8S56]